MKILAIETSCDDTCAGVTENDRIISNIISSQIEFHNEWGGVVPSLAKRLHTEKIDYVIEKALTKAKTKIEDIDFIAATYGPGLSMALEVGLAKAKELAIKYKKPLIPINHMAGHIYSSFAKNSKGRGGLDNIQFPYLALLVSGGHTEMVLMKGYAEFEIIGETLDDAIGEAFDKVSRMLLLGYPGGPIISNLAKSGILGKYDLPIPMKNSKDLNFSYSGLKAATSRLIESIKKEHELSKSDIYNIAATFQHRAIQGIMIKLIEAIELNKVNGIIIGGGVSANIELRRNIRKLCNEKNILFKYPYSKKMCTDNAGMIGTCAYYLVKGNSKYNKDITSVERVPDLKLS